MSAAAPPPDPVIFYTDSCLGKKCAEALRHEEFRVECHQDHFAPDAPDVAWIPVVSQRGWVILTKDKAMKQGTVEFAAVIASGARMFVLGRGNYTGQGMINIFLQHLAKIVAFVASQPGPFIVSLSNSPLRVVYPQTTIKPNGESDSENQAGSPGR